MTDRYLTINDRAELAAEIKRIRDEAALASPNGYIEGRMRWHIPVTPEVVDIFMSGTFLTEDGRTVRMTALSIREYATNLAELTPTFTVDASLLSPIEVER